jgi:fumarylacetoacetase
MAAAARLSSWVPVSPDSDFPLENLPYGVFTAPGLAQPHIGSALGDSVIDLYFLAEHGLFGEEGELLKHQTLNAFMAAGRPAWTKVRRTLQELFSSASSGGSHKAVLEQSLRPSSEVTMQLPATIGDYTDFYSSRPHATNVGIMFRGPDNALQPNWYVSSLFQSAGGLAVVCYFYFWDFYFFFGLFQ